MPYKGAPKKRLILFVGLQKPDQLSVDSQHPLQHCRSKSLSTLNSKNVLKNQLKIALMRAAMGGATRVKKGRCPPMPQRSLPSLAAAADRGGNC